MVKNKDLISAIALITAWFLFPFCEMRGKKDTFKDVQKDGIPGATHCQDIFGNQYLSEGTFKKNSPDSVEIGLWQYTNLDSPLVRFGSFDDGLPVKEWHYILIDGREFISNWNIYQNKNTECKFSLPFDYEEDIFDSTSFRIKTRNDSLGKVSVVLGLYEPMLDEKKLASFNSAVEAGLEQQGFTFTKKRLIVKNSRAGYVLTEFNMKDSLSNDLKLYHLYGNLPSKKRFVELGLYHQGPKAELVKIIFNMVVNNLFVNNERFYNPYLK